MDKKKTLKDIEDIIQSYDTYKGKPQDFSFDDVELMRQNTLAPQHSN